ncbi:MAG: FGGY family carbohydrate kinase, partial [Pseudomonadales bacterium]
MTEALILAFDLGTTRLKVALFDLRGRLVAQVSRRNVDVHDGERSAQSADAWWTDAVTATRELMEHEGIRADHVAGISLSGRAGAAVFVDADGHVFVDPWSDTRHAAQLRRILDQAPGTPNYGA